MLSLQNNFLFVHIPKTGGNSIQRILHNYSEDRIAVKYSHQDGIERFGISSPNIPSSKHSTLAQYKNMLDSNIYDALFKFSCVRNPWERLISFYFSPHHGNQKWDREKFKNMIKSTLGIFHYLSLKETKLDLDFILRYENLQQDFDVVSDKIGLPKTKLTHINQSKRSEHTKYYDDELVELIKLTFKQEINYFEYDYHQLEMI